MPDPGEYHRHPQPVRRLNHLGIPDRPARLNHRRSAGLRRPSQAVREREKRIRGRDRALRAAAPPSSRQTAPRPPGSSGPRRSRPSARARRLKPRIDDRVRLDVLADPPGKEQRPHLLRGRLALGDDLQLGLADAQAIRILHQQAARDLLAGPSASPPASISISRRFFFAAKRSSASGVNDGATIASTNSFAISSAAAASTSRLIPITPPKADTGSASSARR